MSSLQKEIYYDAMMCQMPRLLGLMDRSQGSPAYGCFDRQYWHYRIIDFASARLQEGALTLALAYSIHSPENVYFENPNILRWINASVEFWCKIQEKNGSFNEWYPCENSFVATAFSSYAISETLITLGPELIKEYEFVAACLEKAGNWLIPKAECRAVNQTAGAAISLYNIYEITKEKKYLIASRDKISFLKRNQDEEGWFLEYGGADIGYLSLSIDYLSKYFQKTNDAGALEVIKKAVSFMFNFIDSNHIFGGSCASRNTEYVIPSGLEIISDKVPESRILLERIREAMLNKKVITPSSLDDRYLAYIGYNYLQAFLHTNDSYPADMAQLPNAIIEYPHAGIKIFKNGNFRLIYNYKKGGNFQVIFSNNRIINDWGVLIELKDGKKYSSGWFNMNAAITATERTSLMARCNFQKVKKILFSPSLFIAMRLCILNLKGVQKFTLWFKSKLRDIIITRQDCSDITLSRSFNLSENKIAIIDKIEKSKNIRIVTIGAKMSYIAVPSSAYFQASDLDDLILSYNFTNPGDSIIVRREYDFQGNLISANAETP